MTNASSFREPNHVDGFTKTLICGWVDINVGMVRPRNMNWFRRGSIRRNMDRTNLARSVDAIDSR